MDYLGLGYNQLENIPNEIGNLTNLTFLILSDNKLTTLPSEIQNLQKLTNLYLRGNHFSKEEKEKIKKWLPNCEIEF